MNSEHIEAPSSDVLLTDSEVARLLRIKPRQLFDWRMKGLIPYIKIGKALRYRKTDIEEALRKMTIAR